MKCTHKQKRWLCGLFTVVFVLMGIRIPIRAQEPSVSAQSAVVIEAQTGKILYEKNADEQRPMASTTKIMTALLALEQPGLDESFVVDEAAIQVEGTSMGLKAGDTVTLRVLACGMLMASGNDAANAAAVRIAGDIASFAQKMNERAKQIGMEQTHFVTPSGLDAEGHYSTAYDMAMLAREAIHNEDFLAICSQTKVTAEYGNPPYKRTLSNHNRLLSLYEGAIGVKTGFTKKAGRCLVSAAQRNGVTLICVTLKAPDDWDDHCALFDYGFSKVTTQQREEVFSSTMLPVAGGEREEVRIVPAQKAVFPEIEGQAYTLTYELHVPKFLYAPVQKDDIIGTVVYYADGKEMASYEILVDEDCGVAPQVPQNEHKGFFLGLWETIRGFFKKS